MISSFCCLDLQVNTVGISAPNMMKSIEKKRNPVLLKTLLASLPMLRYSNPIKTPMATWKISLRWVKSWKQIKNKQENVNCYAYCHPCTCNISTVVLNEYHTPGLCR